MKNILQRIRAETARAVGNVFWARRTFVQYVIRHPVLLIPATVPYGIASFAAAFVAAIVSLALAAAIGWIFGLEFRTVTEVGFVFFRVFFFPVLVAIVWLDYLFLAFRCFTSAATLRGYASYPILRVVQLVAVTDFIFAAAHYYVALFSDGQAYKGMKEPVRELGWGPWSTFIDRLIFVPSIETVLDCFYFSTVTMATVGYGDVYPVSPVAKIVTIIQIIFSFGLIAVVLGSVIGQAKEQSDRRQKEG